MIPYRYCHFRCSHFVFSWAVFSSALHIAFRTFPQRLIAGEYMIFFNCLTVALLKLGCRPLPHPAPWKTENVNTLSLLLSTADPQYLARDNNSCLVLSRMLEQTAQRCPTLAPVSMLKHSEYSTCRGAFSELATPLVGMSILCQLTAMQNGKQT